MDTNNLVIEAIQEFAESMRAHDGELGHKPTPPQGKMRVGTKKRYNFKRAKMRRKMAAKSRRINRKG